MKQLHTFEAFVNEATTNKKDHEVAVKLVAKLIKSNPEKFGHLKTSLPPNFGIKDVDDATNESYENKVINEAKQIASQRISARVEAVAYADGNMQIKDIKDNAAIDLYDNDGSIVALYYFLQKHSKSNLKESIDEAMVQVAGKSKPSGARVLAMEIMKYLEDSLLMPANANKKAIEAEIAQLIMDSTF